MVKFTASYSVSCTQFRGKTKGDKMNNNSDQCHECPVGLVCDEAFQPNDIYCLAALDNIKQAQTNAQQPHGEIAKTVNSHLAKAEMVGGNYLDLVWQIKKQLSPC